MGIDFLKKKNHRYQRRRQLRFERELRQGSVFQSCPPTSMTRVRARLLEHSTAQVGDYLWARMGQSADKPLSLGHGTAPVAQLPASLVAPIARESGAEDEIVAEVLGVDDERRRVDLRLASVKALAWHNKK